VGRQGIVYGHVPKGWCTQQKERCSKGEHRSKCAESAERIITSQKTAMVTGGGENGR